MLTVTPIDTQDSILVLGGWSFAPNILRPIFGEQAIYADVNTLIPQLVNDDHLVDNWQERLPEATGIDSLDAFTIVAGWSTGAMLAWSLAQSCSPRKQILLSPASGFCSREQFSAGWKPSVLKIMRRRLRRNVEATLDSFHRQAGLAHPDTGYRRYSADQLECGLIFLQEASLLPLHRARCTTEVWYGTQDAIIPPTASALFAERIGAHPKAYPGGHVFFIRGG
ncbi:MAG: alpha/beta fold hydrolase [Chitinivibrionales bacterium]|nr:alpha/beta fold hydrolase [Chitinivibrionales bacterium]